MRPDVPTEDERLDFLRQVIAYTEWTIRSFDTKAQISIVAFVLSMSPLWSILTSACPRAGSSFIMAFLLLFVTCVLLLAFVVLPGTAMESETIGGWSTKGLIYVRSASQITATSDRLKDLTSEAELVTETLNLARIREIKSRRLKYALGSVFVFYGSAVVAFLLMRNCGATG